MAFEYEALVGHLNIVGGRAVSAPSAPGAKPRTAAPPGEVSGTTHFVASDKAGNLASGQHIDNPLTLERRQADPSGPLSGVELDPLKRLDDRASLFRRGRALATSLAALERRLSRPVLTLDGLAARLRGPLGPGFVAIRPLPQSSVRPV